MRISKAMKGAVAALISTAFAVLGMVAAPSAAHAAGTDRTLTIHYYRPAADYTGWNMWVWGATSPDSNGASVAFDSVEGVAALNCAGVKATFTITDATLTTFGGGLFRKSTDANAWAEKDGGDHADLPEIALNAEGNTDVYLLQGVNATTGPTIVALNDLPARRAIIHYKRTNGNYTGWNMWTWGATAPDSNGAMISFDNTTQDATGSITSTYTIPSSACSETSRQFLLRSTNNWDTAVKDGGDNANITMTLRAQGDTHLWVKQGRTATTTPTTSAAYVKEAQTIGAVGTTVKKGKTLALPAKSNKQRAITWTSQTPTICKISAGKVSGVKVGTCKIRGTVAANAAFTAVTVNKTISVKK
jgi:hypothetical protein